MRLSFTRLVTKWVILPLAAICVVLMGWLAQEVYRDIALLRSTDMDTVQWTLSQVEIEYLDYLLTLEQAIHDPTPNLGKLREDFDILYSRAAIVSTGQLFADVRGVPGFAAASADLLTLLTESTALMDGADIALRAGLPQLYQKTDAIRTPVRALFVEGLAHFAKESDQQRQRISSTLMYLGGLILVMVVGLAGMTLYTRAANIRVREREQDLARANSHMKTILNTALDAVIVSDNQGRVLDLNAAAETTFGYSLETAKGQSIGDLIVPPELREAHRAGLERMITTGARKLVGKGRVQLEAMTASGNRMPVELALQSAQSEQGTVIIAFLRDISQQLEVEAQLREARDQAQAGEKAKAEFLTVMSHEIRTPLNGLLGNLSLLSDSSLTSEQRQYTQNMDISGRQLMHHVNAILDIAKFEAGKLVLNPTSFHLGQLIQDIVDGQSGFAERHQNTIEWAWIGARITWVASDRKMIEQVLLNLVGNAIKFTQSGRISIELEALGPCATEDANTTVEIRVIDTGIGLSEGDQARVFDDFVAARAQGLSAHISTGLGLGIAKRLMALLGGDIGVESSLGEGSVFWIHLPLSVTCAPDAPTDQPIAPLTTRALRVLLAEDNEINAFVAQKFLEREGHHVEICHDGTATVVAATKTVYDVILMDINMPGMDGITATGAIRDLPSPHNHVPILAFSANVLPEQTKSFRAAGMDGFLGKPLERSELREALMAVSKGAFASSQQHPSPPMQSPGDGVRDLIGDDAFARLTQAFITEGDGLVTQLQMAAPEGLDPATLAATCHKIASSASVFGATDYHKALSELELATTGKGDVSLEQALSQLFKIWRQTRDAISSSQQR